MGIWGNPVLIGKREKGYVHFYSTDNESFTIKRTGSASWGSNASVQMQYSTDAQTWQNWKPTTTLTISNGHLYLRGVGITKLNGGYSPIFTLGGNSTSIRCDGNIETLLDYQTVLNLEHPTMDANCFQSMFNGQSKLISPPSLPTTTLSNSCYMSMFQDCVNLESAPKLPATTLTEYCYEEMFRGCTSLTTAPALPATALAGYCYRYMFEGCTSLTTAPALPATALATSCYEYMFQNCTSLTVPPALPATGESYARSFASMFKGCTSLTRLPLTYLSYYSSFCCASMFENCTGVGLWTTSGEGHTYEYRIPASGSSSGQSNWGGGMFSGTAGDAGTIERNHTYYTNAEPVAAYS